MFAPTSALPVEVRGEAKGPFGGAFINPPALPAVAEWFAKQGRPRLAGRAVLIRYADDCAPRRRGREAGKMAT